MSSPPFPQNIIAVIWDYDKTLIPVNMQKPLFDAFQVDENRFWKEVDMRIEEHAKNCRVTNELLYLNHIIQYVRDGRFQGLNNAQLLEFGKSIEFYPGLPEFLSTMKQTIENHDQYKEYDIKLEHYVVSTGLRKIIEGSAIAKDFKDIWGCEFLEDPDTGYLNEVSYVLDHTTKTRAIFEINKGANINPRIELNAYMDDKQRRVPINQMIYVGDGPSDVPVFSVVHRYGGKCYAVYDQDKDNSYNQAYDLQMKEKRVDGIGAADFSLRPKSDTHRWLIRTACGIADSIVQRIERNIADSVGSPPKHIS